MRERRYIEEICVGLMRKVAVLPVADRAVLSITLQQLRERRWYEGRLSEDEYLLVADRDHGIVNSVEPV